MQIDMQKVGLDDNRLRIVMVTGLLILALLIRIVLFMGMDGRDALGYNWYAYSITTGEYEPVRHVMALRFPVILPMALFMWLFGVGEVCSSLPFLGYSMGLLLLTYLLAVRLMGTKIAMIALIILCFYPLNIFNSTDIHADLPMAFFHALSVFLLVRSISSTDLHITSSPLSCVLSGVAVGMSYLCKEPGLAMLPVLLIMLAMLRAGFRRCVLVIGGAALVLAAEMFLYLATTGDAVYRFTTALWYGHRDAVMNYMYTPTPWMWMLEYPEMFVNPLSEGFTYTAGMLLVAVLGLVVGLRNRSRPLRIIILWFVLIFVLFNFMPADFLFRYPAQVHYPRTIDFLTVPASILSAYFISSILGTRMRWVGVAVLAAMLSLGLLCGYVLHKDARSQTDNVRQIVQFIKGHPAAIFYADPRTAAIIRYFMAYSAANIRNYEDFVWNNGCEKYLVYEPNWGEFIREAYGYQFPSWVRDVFESREPVWVSVPASRLRLRGLLGFGPLMRQVPAATIYSLN